jgi:hypothetical protein
VRGALTKLCLFPSSQVPHPRQLHEIALLPHLRLCTIHSFLLVTHRTHLPHPHCALPAAYSYTGLPLTPYQTEKASATALFTYLTRTRVHFDAVTDTIEGHDIWEVGQALPSLPVYDTARASIEGQFTMLVGDAPDRVVSTTSDHFSAGMRALRIGIPKGTSKAQDDAEFSQTTARLAPIESSMIEMLWDSHQHTHQH